MTGGAAVVFTTMFALVVPLAACTSESSTPDGNHGSGQASPGSRPSFPKTLPVEIDGERFSAQQVVVKFHEGTGIEAAQQGWIVGPRQDAADHEKGSEKGSSVREDRLSADVLERGLVDANSAVAAIPGARVLPMISARVDAELDTLAGIAADSGRELADLGLYSFVALPRPDPKAAQRLIDALGENAAVEQVYAQPIPLDADDIDPPTTIDLRPSQQYLSPAPIGIDLPFAHRFRLSRGDGVSVVDVEQGWRLDHEDLPGPDAVFSWHGINMGGDHGTAVAGVMWGRENPFGVDGIAPHARMGWSSVHGAQLFPNPFYSPAAAIANATADLAPGDVVLIEQHVPEWFTGIAFPPDQCNPKQVGYLPVEIYGAEYDAISAATAKGIVVVEAAGNGSMSLNGYPEFDRTAHDSGAIMVGASNGVSVKDGKLVIGDTTPACWTNNGNRVDVFAWGGGVATLGYGPTDALRANGSDERQWYTNSFGGTSSASPIIAGAVAVIQGIRAGQGLPKLTSTQMRTLVSSTGTPQTPGSPIGTQPDLRAALRATLPDQGRLDITGLPKQTRPQQPVNGTLRVTNGGPMRWTASTHKLHCTWPGFATPVTVGQIPGIMDIDDQELVSFTTTTPDGRGALDLRCDLLAGSLVATDVAGTIVTSGNAFNADVTGFQLPATMPYGRDGDLAEPRDVILTVRNTGTQAWDPTAFPDLGVHTRATPGVTELTPLAVPVAPGAQVEITATFECIRPGIMTATVQMALSTVTFGNTRTSQTRCTGTN